MAYPVKPDPAYDYGSFQAGAPTTPLPALQVTNDFAERKQAIDETIDFIVQSFNPSGTLKAYAYPGAETLNEYVDTALEAATEAAASAVAADASAGAADVSEAAAAASAASIVESIYDFGADGAGGAVDLAALDDMLTDLVANLPLLPVWARGPINVGLMIPGPAGTDPMPYLQKIYTAFDIAALQGAHFVYTNIRQWNFPIRPTTGLGPQNQPLTPPRCSIHQWQRGAVWDFSAWSGAFSTIYFRRDGSLGTPLTVVGTVTKGATSITVSSGGTTLKPGDRLLLGNTTELDTLVGAFTLVDAFGTRVAARGGSVIAAGPAVAGVIPLASVVQDTYDTSATPMLYPYEDEPEITLINPTMTGPNAVNDHRAILIGNGRNLQVTGGTIKQFGGTYMIAAFGVLGGFIKGMLLTSTRNPGDAGGGIVYGGDTSGFEIAENNIFGGSQMIMASGTSPFYGITRNVTVRDNNIYNPFNGITTHNTHERLKIIDNNIYGATGTAVDIRCPDCLLQGGYIDGADTALYFRINANGLVVDGLTGKNCVSGIRLTDFSSDWDYDPDDITIRNIKLGNIGGSGSAGGISCEYPRLRDGTPPTIGSLDISNVEISMNNNTTAVTVGGKWARARLFGLRLRGAPGASPAGRSVFIDGAGNGATYGPANPYVEVTQSSSYAVPSVTDFTGEASIETAIGGRTTSRINILTQASTLSERTLIAEQGKTARNAGVFSNQGATALTEAFLPPASSPRLTEFEFIVADADGWKINAGVGDTIQIDGGSPGATAGSISSEPAGTAVIGSRVVIKAFTSAKWVATVDDPANWIVA